MRNTFFSLPSAETRAAARSAKAERDRQRKAAVRAARTARRAAPATPQPDSDDADDAEDAAVDADAAADDAATTRLRRRLALDGVLGYRAVGRGKGRGRVQLRALQVLRGSCARASSRCGNREKCGKCHALVWSGAEAKNVICCGRGKYVLGKDLNPPLTSTYAAVIARAGMSRDSRVLYDALEIGSITEPRARTAETVGSSQV
jgi:hypothetical protein